MRTISYVEAIREALDQEMARDENVIVFGLDVDDRRAEDVAGLQELELHPGADLAKLVVTDRDDLGQHLFHVPPRIERLDQRLGVVALDVQVGGVLLLDLGRVVEHDL